MNKLGLNEIRQKYLQFFANKGHLVLPSSSLVPKNDTSLLFINSGMAPLKSYFIGSETLSSNRATSCQKCIRTPDIDKVGKTNRHGTFFEMLGNFSFGDYFKKEAIAWAWEFIIKELNLPEDKLWISVYEEDQQSFDIWNKEINIPAHKIVKLGKDDNFWEIGVGPCGPCSEIYFDTGEKNGCGTPNCKVGCDCGRYVEFWNLVFTQFNKDESGTYTQLKNPNIDTGMGLERIAAIMQSVDNLFEVDTVKNVLDLVCSIVGKQYKKSEKDDISIRVITDHIRSAVMIVGDGVIPSNEGRGYVLRRLIRRAARHGRLLGVYTPFLHDIAYEVMKQFKDAYPELKTKAGHISKLIKMEEEKFSNTINQGCEVLSQYVDEAISNKQKLIPGDKVFKLHDTYGFPVDLTREIAQENDLDIDYDKFKEEMNNQKEMSRKALENKTLAGWDEGLSINLTKLPSTCFVGYDMAESTAQIVGIIKDEQLLDSAKEGEEVAIILDRTPFYAESGGQAADSGYIKSDDVLIRVYDCKKTSDNKYLHFCEIQSGQVKVSQQVTASVDYKRSMAITRNHTCTHLIHRALKNILGEHVNQSGSLVNEDRLRFDFTHFAQLSHEELQRVENQVNEKILEDIPVLIEGMDFEQAKKLGAMALFEGKYGQSVRVVKVGDYSIELCGGTHVRHTSQIGYVKILGESSIASGIRRIEAVTGQEYIKYLAKLENTIKRAGTILKVDTANVLKRIEQLDEQLINSQNKIEALEKDRIERIAGDVIYNKIFINDDVKVYIHSVSELELHELRKLVDYVKVKVGSGVVAITSATTEIKVNMIISSTKDMVKLGIDCGKIIKNVAKFIDGGGGGRPDMAQAGGQKVAGASKALEQVVTEVKNQIGK